jgi:hypothetical protein
MRVIIVISLFFSLNSAIAQTKKKLIEAIIKINSLDGYDGYDDGDDSIRRVDRNIIDSNNYYNFEKLKRLINHKELLLLSKNKNWVLRLYAIEELVQQNDKEFDIYHTFQRELGKDNKVSTHDGCIVDSELVYSLLYHIYWNAIRIRAKENIDNQKDEALMQLAVEKDPLMYKIDSLVLTSDKNIYWLLYTRALSNRKYDDSWNKIISKLDLKKHQRT